MELCISTEEFNILNKYSMILSNHVQQVWKITHSKIPPMPQALIISTYREWLILQSLKIYILYIFSVQNKHKITHYQYL